jgi:spermidine/putrescine-binding protein
MIGTKRTAALITAMALLGTVAPAAFAQNIAINTDDNVGEENHSKIFQYEADIGRVTNDDGSSTAATALRLALQNANVTQSNNNEDNDDLNVIPIDICALTGLAIFC